MREMYNLTFAYLKNFFALFLDCGYRIADSGLRIPDSCFRIPVSGFLVLRLPYRVPPVVQNGCLAMWEANIGNNMRLETARHPSRKWSGTEIKETENGLVVWDRNRRNEEK